MIQKTFEAKTVDAALKEAAQHFGVSAAELEHEVLEEKSDDFWGLGDTVFVVKAWVPRAEPEAAAEEEAPVAEQPAEAPAQHDEPAAGEVEPATSAFFMPPDESKAAAPVAAEPAVSEPVTAPVAKPAAPAVEPSAEAPPARAQAAAPEPGAAGEDLSDDAVALVTRIFEAMEFDCRPEARLEGETLHVAITGEDNQYLLDGRGRGLSALELILNHAFRHREARAHKRVRVDAGDFRSQREDELRDMAYQVAHQAKESGQTQETTMLNAYERRIVHLTLADDTKVTTRSIGDGFKKAVSVIPSGGRG